MCARVHTQTREVLPRFLYTKFRLIESGVAFGKEITLEVEDSELDQPYAFVRQAQLRGIAQLAITDGTRSRGAAGSKKVTTAHVNTAQVNIETGVGAKRKTPI
mmetsp:Transcript_20217/g.29656  ORF Transcript_20217/g.29656 Transcript_20217/m.29656 type:complete len:103 (-) Transcript_20217:87-395(-)